MNNRRSTIYNKGYTLIELMIAMIITTLMSLAVLSIFINQTTSLTHETQRDSAVQEANRTFDLLSRLLRQAHQDSINISYPASVSVNTETTPEIDNDGISVDFTLPSGFNIWPNDKAPYQNNSVRIKWDNNTTGTKPYIVQIASAIDIDVASSNLQDLAGDNQGDQARIINLDLWPLANQRELQDSATKPANSGYLLRVTARTAKQDISYDNPNIKDDDSPLKHYRTYTVSGVIAPRN